MQSSTNNPRAATRTRALLVFTITACIPEFSRSFSTSSSLSSLHTLPVQSQLQTKTSLAALYNYDDDHNIHNDRIFVSRRKIMWNTVVTSGSILPSIFRSPSMASAAASTDSITAGAEKFCGTFSDPINHPGGTRTISLIENSDVGVGGDYRLAKVVGGGGLGEPKEYVLPAVAVGDRAIIIDFSPKGGPRDFTGILEKDGAIQFLRDGNRWPRLN